MYTINLTYYSNKCTKNGSSLHIILLFVKDDRRLSCCTTISIIHQGRSMPIDSPSSCGVFEYSQTDACPEAPSSSSVTVNPTENLRLTKEVGIQCGLLVCENQVAMTSTAIQTADVCPPSVDVSDIVKPGTPIAVVDCLFDHF